MKYRIVKYMINTNSTNDFYYTVECKRLFIWRNVFKNTLNNPLGRFVTKEDAIKAFVNIFPLCFITKKLK